MEINIKLGKKGCCFGFVDFLLTKIRVTAKEAASISLWRAFFLQRSCDRYQSKNVLLFSRKYDSHFSLVAFNFSDQDMWVPFTFPFEGDYREELHGYEDLPKVLVGEERWLSIPNNYGRIWTAETD
jgi:hypothetical protein